MRQKEVSMKKWIVVLVCTVVAGAAAGGIATRAAREIKTETLERRGCNLVIGNDSEDVIYAISVSYHKNGIPQEAVNSQYMNPGTEAYFSVSPSGGEDCVVTIRLDSHQTVTARLGEEFEPDEMNIYWLTEETDGEYLLNVRDD